MNLKGGIIGVASCLSVAFFASSANASGTLTGSINFDFAAGTTLQLARYNPFDYANGAQFGYISEYDGVNSPIVATGVFADGGMYKFPSSVGTPWVDSVTYGGNMLNASYDAYAASFGVNAVNDPAMVFTNPTISIHPTLYFTPTASFAPFSYTYSLSGDVDQPGYMYAAIQITVGYANDIYGTGSQVLYTNFLNPAAQYPNAYNDPDYYHSGIVNTIFTGDITKWVYASEYGDTFVTSDGSEKYWYVALSLDGNVYDYTGDPVPIPGAVWLLGPGIAALAGLRKRLKS